MAAIPLIDKYWSAWRLRWLASPWPLALRQWQDGLLALVPESLRRLWFPPQRRLLLRFTEDGGLCLLEQVGDELSDRGHLPDDPGKAELTLRARLDSAPLVRELILLLPQQDGLTRLLPLPLAAEIQLDAVLAHEIDRQTPFTVEQVVYSAEVLSRDRGAGQLLAELTVLPRATLERALTRLGPLAAHLAGVDIDDHAHRRGRRRNLLPLERRRLRGDPDRRVRWALLVITFSALLLTLLLTLDNRRAALAALQAERDAAFELAREARSLRAQLESAALAAGFLAEQRRLRPTMLEVLDDLSRRLPDDVFLQRLSIEQDRVSISGVARSAGAVVATLQPSPHLRGAALVGAVQPDPHTGRDGFTIVAELAGGGSDAQKP